MKREEAFQVIGKHIFTAHRRSTLDGEIVILADSQDEAEEKAKLYFGISSVIVRLVSSTEDAQVYKI